MKQTIGAILRARWRRFAKTELHNGWCRAWLERSWLEFGEVMLRRAALRRRLVLRRVAQRRLARRGFWSGRSRGAVLKRWAARVEVISNDELTLWLSTVAP